MGVIIFCLRALPLVSFVVTCLAFVAEGHWLLLGMLLVAVLALRPVSEDEMHMRAYYLLKEIAPPILLAATLVGTLLLRFWTGAAMLGITAVLMLLCPRLEMWLVNAYAIIGLRLRGARRQARARIMLTNAGDAWVELTQGPKEERSLKDLGSLCMLYGPKMVCNAGDCYSARWFVGDLAVFLGGRTRSSIETPSDLAEYLLRKGSGILLTKRPEKDELLGTVTVDLYRNALGTPTIQTYFPRTVGPEHCIASIRFLWAWTALHLGETAMDRLWMALGLLAYYEREHADAHGHIWDFEGFLACASYVVNMLATPLGEVLFDLDSILDSESEEAGEGDLTDLLREVGKDVS